MIKIEKWEVFGWDAAIRGMRNPMNSWEKSDSGYGCDLYANRIHCRNCNVVEKGSCMAYRDFAMGPNDYELMMKLAKSGPVHAKYRRMITVYVDITAPLYWWKEFDTYKVGTVANSCSTMHKIHEKEFTIDDFSTDHLLPSVKEAFDTTIVGFLNSARECYFDAKNGHEKTKEVYTPKDFWWQIIQILPSSYNQKRTVMLNYEVLANIYKYRKNHKLDEWVEFCEWIVNELPYRDIITGPNCNKELEESAE